MDLTGVGSVAGLIQTVVNKIWKDPAQQAEAALKLKELEQTGELARLTADADISKAILAVGAAEAASGSLWVAGWRPFIGWAGGSALAFQAIVAPIFDWVAKLAGATVSFPHIDASVLGSLVATMITGQVMRSYDKKNSKAGD